MPLLPPPAPVEHPADLVIDAFGTFLGKRSERMVVRWRGGSATRGCGSESDRTPDDGSQSSDVPADLPPTESSQTDVLCGGSAAAPPEAVDRPPSVSNVAPSSTRERDEAGEPAASGRRFSLIGKDEDGQEPRPAAWSGPDEEARHPADAAVDRLKFVWSDQPVSIKAPPSPCERLAEQLSRVGVEFQGDDRGEWRETSVPLSRLRSVTVSGRGITISSDLIEALVERGIPLSFLNRRGQPVAQLNAPGLSGTVQTRRSQLAAYSQPLGVQLAVEFVRGKLRNQKHQLQYSGKYLKSAAPERWERLQKKIAVLGNLRRQLRDFHSDDLDRDRDRLMGFEGTGARVYWEGVAILLEGKIDFPGRMTRGAGDPVNSALNYGYGILYSQVSAAIANAGLELYAGFLHVDRPGKPSLVLDLVEEFRAPVVDRVVLAIVNQGILLETDERGLTAATRRLIAARVMERLSTPEPYEGKRWSLRSIIQSQARHLAVAVRGERTYRCFASRW